MGWPINPDGLKAVLLNIRERYGNPKMFVTENGCALEDAPDADGFVEDWARVDYLRAHMRAIYDAIQAGANVCGFYVWSLMDNFEWIFGYTPRFGLIRVDYQTGRRIPKQSARWYNAVITNNAVSD